MSRVLSFLSVAVCTIFFFTGVVICQRFLLSRPFFPSFLPVSCQQSGAEAGARGLKSVLTSIIDSLLFPVCCDPL